MFRATSWDEVRASQGQQGAQTRPRDHGIHRLGEPLAPGNPPTVAILHICVMGCSLRMPCNVEPITTDPGATPTTREALP
jgi:hypothetical protein